MRIRFKFIRERFSFFGRVSMERGLDGVGGVLFSAEDKKANEKEEHKENAEGLSLIHISEPTRPY